MLGTSEKYIDRGKRVNEMNWWIDRYLYHYALEIYASELEVLAGSNDLILELFLPSQQGYFSWNIKHIQRSTVTDN